MCHLLAGLRDTKCFLPHWKCSLLIVAVLYWTLTKIRYQSGLFGPQTYALRNIYANFIDTRILQNCHSLWNIWKGKDNCVVGKCNIWKLYLREFLAHITLESEALWMCELVNRFAKSREKKMFLEVLYILLLHRSVYYVQCDDHYVEPTGMWVLTLLKCINVTKIELQVLITYQRYLSLTQMRGVSFWREKHVYIGDRTQAAILRGQSAGL